MTKNIAFSRPAGAMLVLLAIAVLGTVAVWLAFADRAVLAEERDAKVSYVSRSLVARRANAVLGGDAGPAPDLAIAADSATLAAARVDALVRATVVEAGGVVLSSRAEARGGEGRETGDERIEIQAVIQGSMEAIQTSLYRIESGRPVILVDSLDLRATEPAGATGPPVPVLTATLTLSAFWAPRP